MIPNNNYTSKVTLEWLTLAYIGVLLRSGLNCLLLTEICGNGQFALELIWVTIVIPIFINRWGNAWLLLPREAQWIIAFLLGFYSLSYLDFLPSFP